MCSTFKVHHNLLFLLINVATTTNLKKITPSQNQTKVQPKIALLSTLKKDNIGISLFASSNFLNNIYSQILRQNESCIIMLRGCAMALRNGVAQWRCVMRVNNWERGFKNRSENIIVTRFV